MRNIFLQKSWENWDRNTSSKRRFVFQKTSKRGKISGVHLSLIYFNNPRLGHNKNKKYKMFDWNLFNFDFLKKSLGIVSPLHFVYDFFRKMYVMLYFVNWYWATCVHRILPNPGKCGGNFIGPWRTLNFRHLEASLCKWRN